MMRTTSPAALPRFGMLLSVFAITFALAARPAPAAAFDGNGGDRVSFGGDVTVQDGQEVTGDLVVFGGSAKVYGKVDGDAVVMGGDLYIAPSGAVDGSTVAFGGSVDNESKAKGGRHNQNTTPLETSPPIMPIVPPEPIRPPDFGDRGGPATGWIGFLVITGILSLLTFALVPNTVRTVRDELMRRPIVGTAVGFCWPFILIAIVIALCITVIGIVLIPAAVVGVAVAYLVGRAAVALMLGRRLFEVANVVEPAPLATAALGIVIITVIEAIVPLWMGIVLEAIVGAVAIGASMLPFLRQRALVAAPAGYSPPPQPMFTPPAPPPPSGPPAVPQ